MRLSQNVGADCITFNYHIESVIFDTYGVRNGGITGTIITVQ